MKTAKVYKIQETKHSYKRDRIYTQIGTLEELVRAYSYTLDTGKSYENERGNKKIKVNPKSINTLLKNLYNAKNNSAANGYSGCYFEEVPVTDEDLEEYLSDRA